MDRKNKGIIKVTTEVTEKIIYKGILGKNYYYFLNATM